MDLHPAYLAGFVDGEGCISVYENGRKTSHTLVVQIVQNRTVESTELLKSIELKYGGKVSEYRSTAERQKYNLLIQGANAASFLEEILPFLVLKKAQAEVAINWYRSRPKTQRNNRGWHIPVSAEQRLVDKNVDQRLRDMKRAA